jgi:uncharacterized protein (DUF1778 family)
LGRKLIAVRLSKEERDLLSEAAVIRRLPLSSFLREAALAVAGVERAERDLEAALHERERVYVALAESPSPQPEPDEAKGHVLTTYPGPEAYLATRRGGFTPGPGVRTELLREARGAGQASRRPADPPDSSSRNKIGIRPGIKREREGDPA